MDIKSYIPEDLLEKYEFHNYNHALEIITQAFPEEWNELVTCLRKLNISVSDLQAAGGNETNIPKNSMMFCILSVGGKSAFPGICISNSFPGKRISAGASRMNRLRNELLNSTLMVTI